MTATFRFFGRSFTFPIFVPNSGLMRASTVCETVRVTSWMWPCTAYRPVCTCWGKMPRDSARMP
jgi:hypothetical protein